MESSFFEQLAQPAHELAEATTVGRFIDLTLSGRITQEEYDSRLVHEILRAISRKLGYAIAEGESLVTGEQDYSMLDGPGTFSKFSPVCTYCLHKHLTMSHTCDAFPIGIPDEIWRGENTHTNPYPGDGGIHFERRQPKASAGKSSGRKRPEP